MRVKQNLIGTNLVAIECDGREETFEMCMNPVYLSSCSDTESESKDCDPAEYGVSDSLFIRQLVENQDWARMLEFVSQNKILAQLPFEPSSSDPKGDLLLHYVCKKNAPFDVVEYVLKANEIAASTPGESGFLPLHYACASGAPIAVIEALVDAYPRAVKVREKKKSRLPLHLATRGDGDATAEVIALLMSYYPEATMSGDANGLRPLDYAANTSKSNKKTRWEIVSVLEMGQKWIRVGQNVTQRLEQDFAERLRALEKDIGSYVESLKAVHDEEIARIANDILDVEFNSDVLAEDGREDLRFQAKFDELVQKHDRFLSLQEESRWQRLEFQSKKDIIHEYDNESLVEGGTGVHEKTKQFANAESEQTETEKDTDIISKREQQLMARIAALETSERLKVGVIKKILYMAQEKERNSQENIVELVAVINDQQAKIEMFMGQIDLCEEQLQVLKHHLSNSAAIKVD